MAKTSSIERNKKRERLAKQYAARRAKLRAVALNENLPLEERFDARLKLAQLPRNSAPITHPQSVRADGASACFLSQTETVSYRAA